MGTAAIVADDLTGATDSAVQFATAGWSATLLLDRRHAGARRAAGDLVLAGTADNRALPAGAARDAAGAAVDDLLRLGAERLFVKIDSTMRGSVTAHVSGALSAWRRRTPDAVAVLCPAYPGMGRRVEQNVVLVDNAPVADSAFRRDPVTPVRASALDELLPGSVPLAGFGPLPVAEAVERAVDFARRGGGDIFTADGRTDADLDRLAEAIAGQAGTVIPVGSAGLAAAMARAWRPASGIDDRDAIATAVPAPTRPRVLVQVTTLNDVSHRQLAILASQPGRRCLHLDPDLATLLDDAALERWFAGQPADSEEYDLVVLSAPGERAAAGDPPLGASLAERLGGLSARLLRTGRFGVAGFVGGDGARAALAQLRVTALEVHGSLEDGIPVSVPLDGDAADIVVFTKAGGFGAPESLASVVARLTAPTARRSNA